MTQIFKIQDFRPKVMHKLLVQGYKMKRYKGWISSEVRTKLIWDLINLNIFSSGHNCYEMTFSFLCYWWISGRAHWPLDPDVHLVAKVFSHSSSTGQWNPYGCHDDHNRLNHCVPLPNFYNLTVQIYNYTGSWGFIRVVSWALELIRMTSFVHHTSSMKNQDSDSSAILQFWPQVLKLGSIVILVGTCT